MKRLGKIRLLGTLLLAGVVLGSCGILGDDDQGATEDPVVEEVVVSSIRVQSGDRWFEIDPSDVEVTDAGQPTDATITLLTGEVENLSLALAKPQNAGIVHDGTNFVVESSVPGQAPDFAELARQIRSCLLYTSPSPRDRTRSRMPSSA